MIKKQVLIIVFIIPITLLGQLSKSHEQMISDKEITYEKYEKLLFKATNYIFNNPVNKKSKEFVAATKIVSFWMNKDTGMGIPTFGSFYTSLTNKDHQQFLYIVAMINYGLNQKINHDRVLACSKIEGQKYSEQNDVKEVQLGGAKILLKYISNKENNVQVNSKTKKYIKAYKNGTLDEIFFE